MTLCKTFQKLAMCTWFMIGNSRKVSYQIKEETITDLILLELKLWHSGEIIVKEFNKQQEGTNGADWEWWFRGSSGKWIGFRVQAKIINIGTNEFKQISYYKKIDNINVKQSKLLVANAEKENVIPIYCFYLHTGDENILNNFRFVKYPNNVNIYGCSIIYADELNKMGQNQLKFTNLAKYMFPWHLLVCDGDNIDGKFDLIGNLRILINKIIYGIENNGENELIDKYVVEDPPSYVQKLFNGEEISVKSYEDKGLKGVVVIKEQG